MQQLYSWGMVAAQPLLRRKLHRRGVAEPGYLEHVEERFGRYEGGTAPGRLWIHAVSLGETRAAAILLEALRAAQPDLRILLTHGTATGRAEGASLLRLLRRNGPEPAVAGASIAAGPATATAPSIPELPSTSAGSTSVAPPRTAAVVLPERSVVTDTSPVLEVRNLSKRFRGLQAVDDVSFDLARGKITALIGPNGAGKTTIFNLLTRVITPDTGTVTLNGEDISGLSPHRIAKRGMARSFQDGRLFERLTAVENVMLAVPGNSGENLALLATRPLHCRARDQEARELALEALGFVGMRAQAGTVVADLSFGDQKLVAIARLLATQCDVLLLDEPTSGVDPGAVEGVIEVVRGLRDAGKTVCLVEHSVHMVGHMLLGMGIAWEAHAGGFIAGALLMSILPMRGLSGLQS